MGLFEGGKQLAQKAMTGQSKDDAIAEKIFDFFSSKGFPSKKGLRGRGAGDYHYRKFESQVAGVKALEIKVSRIGTSGGIGGNIGNITKTLGPQRVKIEFILVYKEGGFLGKGRESKRFEFNLNADEYIDNQLKVKDETALQKIFNGYWKNLGFPSD